MDKRNVTFEDAVEAIGTLNASQVAELIESVKDRPSTARTLETVLRTIAILKFVDAIESIQPFRREDAVEFMEKSSRLIRKMRAKGKTNAEITIALDDLAKSLDERERI